MKNIVLFLTAAMAFFACSSPASTGDGDTDTGLFVDLTFSDTSAARGVYIWIEDDAGDYVNTIQQYFGSPTESYSTLGHRFSNDLCNDWQAAAGESSGSLVVDGLTAASVLIGEDSHSSATWDLDGVTGASIPAGDYTVQVEVTYHDNTSYTSRATGTINLNGDTGSATLNITDSESRLSSAEASFSY